MPTARQIITDALTIRLNVLSAGATMDNDLSELCRNALNSIVDGMNGGTLMLWREATQTATITGVSGTLGSSWASIAYGAHILGATYTSGGSDQVIDPITIEQYQTIPVKTTTGLPFSWAHDGGSTVYFYPAPVAVPITLRYAVPATEFADLDTSYVMPSGYRSWLASLLAESVAGVLTGGLSATVARAANAARASIKAATISPAIINGGNGQSALAAFFAGA